jgi:DNA methylase
MTDKLVRRAASLVLPAADTRPLPALVHDCRKIFDARHAVIERADLQWADDTRRTANAIERLCKDRASRGAVMRAQRVLECTVGAALGNGKPGRPRKTLLASKVSEKRIPEIDRARFRLMYEYRHVWLDAIEQEPLPSRAQVLVSIERVRGGLAQARERAATFAPDPRFIHGDFRDVAAIIPDETVALILADPPWNQESLQLYGALAAIAARVLARGGSLVTYAGHYLVPAIYDQMRPNLRPWWMLAGVMSTGPYARMREYGVIVRWKPILWFVRETYGRPQGFIEDVIDSPAKEKSHHAWQQSQSQAEDLIGRFSVKGDLVWDPFCGGGTTAAAAVASQRRFVTCDIDAEALQRAQQRLDR